ncbi:MAG: KPN_02809 family neutral zinc metallopeptidase [Nocardioides sp.]
MARTAKVRVDQGTFRKDATMRFNPKARLDTSRTSDGGGGGGGMGGAPMRLPIPGGTAGGGGLGLLSVIVFFVVSQCLGGNQATQSGSGIDTGRVAAGDTARYESCKVGADATANPDCERIGVENSLFDFWQNTLPDQDQTQFEAARLRTFTGAVSTGCGNATSQVGPFYCPGDATIYMDTTFFDDVLERQLGGPDGGFVQAYVLAHEYGHHIENLRGTMGKVRTQQGPRSDAVRLELQADCFAGMWANAATRTQDSEGETLIAELTEDDIRLALEGAAAVGDDRIQRKTQGQVNEEAWTHGSAESRMRWFQVGYTEGTIAACDQVWTVKTP